MSTFLFFFIVCGLIPVVTTDLTMMIVWGIPNDTEYADIYENTTWSECLQTCLDAQPCLLAYQSDETTCMNFDYNCIDTVSKTTSSSGSRVAFKVENPTDECPVGSSAPTFNGTTTGGSLYVDYDKNYFPQWIYYTVDFSGSSWEINYKRNASCSSKFQDIIEHSDGTGYCYTTWYLTGTTGFSYNDSDVLCRNKTATLASLYYPEDTAHFNELADELRSDLSNPNTYVRLDGMRTAACQKTPTTAACMTVSGFTFTGIPPANFDNYNWVTNAGAQATADDNCIVLVVNGTQEVKADVRGCDTTSPLQAGLIFCGTPAWAS